MKMTVGRLDLLLILPLFASIMMIGEGTKIVDDPVVLTPLPKSVILGVGALIVALLVARATSLERRCSEDYLVQLTASAGLIAVGTTALINMFWVLTAKFIALPDLAGENMAGITIFAWIASYYWFRLRGFNA